MIKSGLRSASPSELQLASILDHDKPRAVLAEVKRIFAFSYAPSDFSLVTRAFGLVERLYEGHFDGYQACRVEYHDFCHVLEVFSATARLLDGATLSGLPFTLEEAIDLLIAALLHDSGYIQEKGDTQGTGAKYTKTHVDRSASFALAQAATFGLSSDGAGRVSRWILGTDLARPWAELNLPGKREGDAAAILAAADILGQMGDRAYLEKLLFLYYEFKEAGITGYGSAYDILEKTLGFYEGVKKRLDVTLASTKDYASRHFSARYGTDRDLYREAIQRQMDYLAGIVADDGSNFRKKLKRMDLEAVEAGHKGGN